MRKLTCAYKENPGSGDSYKAQLVDGRCRVYLVWCAGETVTTSGATAPQIKFYNGSTVSGSDLRLQLTDTTNYEEAFYGSHWVLDLPSEGILFEDGVWVHFPDDGYAVTVLISGGAEA